MSEDVWSAQDTNPDAIEAALRELLRQRHAANPSLAPARVLNLVVVVDRAWKGEIANRLERVGRYHASRTVLCAVDEGREQLDAVVVMSYEDPAHGGIGVILERVEIDMGPSHLASIDTIVDPVIAPEMPTVLWSPHRHEGAIRSLAQMTDVMLVDSDDDPEPAAGLARAQERLETSYVVDLAWLRTTPWRERLAASFDPPHRRPALRRISELTVRHRADSAASAALIAGWLSTRLGWEPSCLETVDERTRRADARRNGDRLVVELREVEQDVPGLAGITVSGKRGFSLSLDRGRGGLQAKQVLIGGDTSGVAGARRIARGGRDSRRRGAPGAAQRFDLRTGAQGRARVLSVNAPLRRWCRWT